MIDKEKTYQETKEDLESAIISKLFALPAFKLDKKKAKIFQTYAVKYLANSISRNKFGVNSDLFNRLNNINPTATDRSHKIPDLYDFRGECKKLNITLNMLPPKAWFNIPLLILLSIIIYFSVRQNGIFWAVVALISTWACSFVFCRLSINFLIRYILVQNTFTSLSITLKQIQGYIDNIYSTNNSKKIIAQNAEKIEYFSNVIVKEFVEEEIRQIDFTLKEVYLSPIINGFMLSFVTVWITGDQLVIIIQELTKFTNLIKYFPVIQNMTVQTFWIFFLFPFSIAWAKYIIVEASKKRSNNLHKSLFLLRLYENNQMK